MSTKQKSMVNFFKSENDYVFTFLRVILGITIFAHGAQKLLGWWGGYGFEGTMGFMTQALGIPALFAFLAIVFEFFGGIALIIGLGTRLNAFAIGMIMLVAIFTVHLQHGFFLGGTEGSGIEFNLALLAISVAIMFKGAGAFGLDSLIANKLNNNYTIKHKEFGNELQSAS